MRSHAKHFYYKHKKILHRHSLMVIEISIMFYRYLPYPGGGEKWGGNGVGDDFYSFGFDGANLWTGTYFLRGKKKNNFRVIIYTLIFMVRRWS